MSRYISDKLRTLVEKRAGGICEYCLISIEDTYLGSEVEHIISLKHGGKTSVENRALSCQPCNRNKGSDLGSINERTKRLIRFYNPRKDKWAEHFYLNEAKIEPITEIGKATGKIFGFNDWERIQERSGLIQIEHFPSEKAKKLLG